MPFSKVGLAKGPGSVALVAACLALGGSPTAAAPQEPGSPRPAVRLLQTPADETVDGEARVTVDIAPVHRETELTIDADAGADAHQSTARGDRANPTRDDASADADADAEDVVVVLADPVPESAGVAVAAAAQVAAPAAVSDPIVDDTATAPPPVDTAPPPDVLLGDIDTGGQQGATVIIGDTRGGQGAPGASGGDAIVDISIGPISDGVALPGDASAGVVVPVTPDPAARDQHPSDDVLVDVPFSSNAPDADPDAALLGLFTALGLAADDGETGPATPGSAVGGSAERGDASVLVVVGDTIGGDAAGGQLGGDAIVKLDVGPVVGGDATGGDAVGGDAVRGGGRAVGGDAAGGDARGGDAVVVIGVGTTRGGDGSAAGPGGDAAVLVDLRSISGGDAVGGDATGGEGSGLLGINGTGGDAAGGDAAGGTAFAVIRVDELAGGQYRADVDQIVGGDASGGDAVGGDALDLTVDADVLLDLRLDDGR